MFCKQIYVWLFAITVYASFVQNRQVISTKGRLDKGEIYKHFPHNVRVGFWIAANTLISFVLIYWYNWQPASTVPYSSHGNHKYVTNAYSCISRVTYPKKYLKDSLKNSVKHL